MLLLCKSHLIEIHEIFDALICFKFTTILLHVDQGLIDIIQSRYVGVVVVYEMGWDRTGQGRTGQDMAG